MGFRLQKVEQHAGVEVTIEFAALVSCEYILLILYQEFVQALAIVRVELDAEYRTRRDGREIVVVGLNSTGQNGCFSRVDGGGMQHGIPPS